MSEPGPTVFVSCCHADEAWKDQLVKHLRVFDGALSIWDDRQIVLGQDWRAEIARALTTASAAVLLVSVDFLTSRFILDEEVPALLRRQQAEGLRIFPVIVGACAWDELPWLSALQVRPRDGRPLELHTRAEANAALASIAKEIGGLLRQRSALAPVIDASPAQAPYAAAPGHGWPSVWQPAAAAHATPKPPQSAGHAGAHRPFLTPAAPPPETTGAGPPVALRSFAFETMVLDPRGAIRARRTLQAQEFVETLGAGAGLEMVAIPAGTFAMGAPDGEPRHQARESPVHQVSIDAFFLSRHAITQLQWRAVAALPRVMVDLDPDPAYFKGKQRPVERVAWPDAVEFCERLARHTGRAYRLPSEAEWEYAARAGTTSAFAFGATLTSAIANYDGRYVYGEAAVGLFRQATTDVGALGVANTFGLFDLHGNVWEWTLDPWHDDYMGAPTDESAWTSSGQADQRVVRGGSWFDDGSHCRSAFRNRLLLSTRSNRVGFRVACSRAPLGGTACGLGDA